MKVKHQSQNIFLRMHPLQRVMISILFSVLIFFSVLPAGFNAWLNALIIWVTFAFSFLVSSWIVLLKRPTEQIKSISAKEDGSTFFVLAAILIASVASMAAVLIIILPKGADDAPKIVYLPVALAAMIFSWAMVHTTLSFHYAHLFYNPSSGKPAGIAGGLVFPGEEEPKYLDFAYFAFVVGMTFQVSDVQINSSAMRRLVLFHGLLSFALNTFVVALTINVIAGLTK